MNSGDFIIVGVLVLAFVGVVFGYYTKTGTEIDQHPSDGLSHDGGSAAPGSKGSGELGGIQEGEHDPFDSHGTG